MHTRRRPAHSARASRHQQENANLGKRIDDGPLGVGQPSEIHRLEFDRDFEAERPALQFGRQRAQQCGGPFELFDKTWIENFTGSSHGLVLWLLRRAPWIAHSAAGSGDLR
jgi:hypothetical protein